MSIASETPVRSDLSAEYRTERQIESIENELSAAQVAECRKTLELDAAQARKHAVALSRGGKHLTADEWRSLKTNLNIWRSDEELLRWMRKQEKRDRLAAEVSMSVVKEPSPYGPESPQNSYVCDSWALFQGTNHPNYRGAEKRMAAYAVDVRDDMRRGGKRAAQLRKALGEYTRRPDEVESRRLYWDYEARLMNGDVASGAAFMAPTYMVADYAPARARRVTVDQANQQPLPAYGMSVNLPITTTRPDTAVQANMGDDVTFAHLMTATLIEQDLVTIAGGVPVAQQLLDRTRNMPYGMSFDQELAKQMVISYGKNLNDLVLAAMIAQGVSVPYLDGGGFTLTVAGAPGVGNCFVSRVSQAAANIRTTENTYLDPTHVIVTPDRYEGGISPWVDAVGQPVIHPDYQGMQSGVNTRDKGGTGYLLDGLPLFADPEIPVDGNGLDQAIVADMTEVYVWQTETPLFQILVGEYADQMAAYPRIYGYAATMLRYPAAVQSINGSGMSAPDFAIGS